MKIRVLPDVVVNQIAAGEVVDRPASVVRELVDNALDSGADDILVTLDGGGNSRVTIRDNGCGMSRDDALLAFERHATSKISTAADLWDIQSLGFRGEALASIGAVAKIRLRTRERDSTSGTEVTIEGGRLSNVSACAWGGGTEIEVRHLFYNMPARRKFLKSQRAELTRIKSWLQNVSLTRLEVRFRLVEDGREVLSLPRVADRLTRAQSIFQTDLIPVSLTGTAISVSGGVAHPSIALSDNSGLVIFVNGRLVSDKIVTRAVRDGFDSMLKEREFPVGFLCVDVDPKSVDVNVHPQKSEIRFRDPHFVFEAVRDAVSHAVRELRAPTLVQKAVHTPSLHVESSEDFPPVSIPMSQYPGMFSGAAAIRPEPSVPYAAPARSFAPQAQSFAAGSPIVANSDEKKFQFHDLKFIGQALGCYLLCELDDQLVVVDMHAAHERVNYNRIRSALHSKSAMISQSLLVPLYVSLSPDQVVVVIEMAEHLAKMGVRVAPHTDRSVAVVGVPLVLSHLNVQELLSEIATQELAMAAKETIEKFIDHMAARVACHASIRSGDAVTRDGAYALFAALDDTSLSTACPHGRPVVVSFGRSAVERWFGRDR